jgi:hypothetical protein
MKRLVLALVLGGAVAGTADAQVARSYAGLSGGATYSNYTNYNVASDWRWGGTAGAFIGTTTFDYSFIELSPAWVQEGGDDFRADYIDIPLLIGGLVPIGNRDAIFRLYAGIGLGVKLSCSETDCDALNSTMWSLPVGISFAKAMGTGKFIGLDARYSIGLSDAFELSIATQKAWQFRAFFGIPIMGR